MLNKSVPWFCCPILIAEKSLCGSYAFYRRKSMEMEIQSLLEKLLDINDSMSRCAASSAPSTSVTQKLARHGDILHEFTRVLTVSSFFITL